MAQCYCSLHCFLLWASSIVFSNYVFNPIDLIFSIKNCFVNLNWIAFPIFISLKYLQYPTAARNSYKIYWIYEKGFVIEAIDLNNSFWYMQHNKKFNYMSLCTSYVNPYYNIYFHVFSVVQKKKLYWDFTCLNLFIYMDNLWKCLIEEDILA